MHAVQRGEATAVTLLASRGGSGKPARLLWGSARSPIPPHNISVHYPWVPHVVSVVTALRVRADATRALIAVSAHALSVLNTA